MAIITISRELATLGDETARQLATLLGYRLVERAGLDERMKSLGADESALEKFDEKKPSLLTSFSKEKDEYIHYFKEAVFAEALEGKCVFIGEGAGMVLKGVPGVLHVFLTAPVEIRAERVKNYFHCDEKRARQIIDQADKDRDGYHRHFFDINWKDSANCHLTLNTGFLHPDLCAALIIATVEETINDETEKNNVARLKELSLAHEIKHCILYDKGINIQFLEVAVNEKTIELYGAASSQVPVESAVKAVKELAAGYSIKSEIQVVQEYSVIH